MKNILIIAILLSLIGQNILSCSEDSPSESKLTFGEKLQEALDNGIELYKGKGISVAVIMPDGQTWTAVSGVSRGTTLINKEMLFSAGSITKTFTAATILQLADEGILTLEDSLHKWLPDYPNIDNTITIRQLLNHTNGIYDLDDNPLIYQDLFADHEKIWALEDVVSTYTLTPNFPKGTSWYYSNTGYILLRMIIREATGSEISTEYRKRLFEPSGLSSAFLAPEENSTGSIAQGWLDLDNDGEYDELPFMTSFYSMAGGGVFCTAKDLAIWANALFHDQTVLTESSFEQMLSFYSPCPDEELVAGYGLGVTNFASELFNYLNLWGHGGNALGYAAGCFYLPDYGVSIGIMDNTEEGDAMYIINNILSIVTDHLNETSSLGKADNGFIPKSKRGNIPQSFFYSALQLIKDRPNQKV